MSTPRCTVCGAKFSHDNVTLSCRICGVPDEIVDLGPQVVARWKRKTIKSPRVTQSQKEVLTKSRRGGSLSKLVNKHGRKGVKHYKLKNSTTTSRQKHQGGA